MAHADGNGAFIHIMQDVAMQKMHKMKSRGKRQVALLWLSQHGCQKLMNLLPDMRQPVKTVQSTDHAHMLASSGVVFQNEASGMRHSLPDEAVLEELALIGVADAVIGMDPCRVEAALPHGCILLMHILCLHSSNEVHSEPHQCTIPPFQEPTVHKCIIVS